MSVKHQPSVEQYISTNADLYCFADNLQEFLDTLPAPDKNNELPSPMHYGHLGSLAKMRELAAEMALVMDEFHK
jgi:hypothetical protein